MVKYVEYQGKQLPIRVSYYAMKVLKEKSGKRFEDIDQDVELYLPLFYASLQAGAWAVNQPLEIKEEDAEKVLDVCFFDFIKLIPEFFQTSANFPPPPDSKNKVSKNVHQPKK